MQLAGRVAAITGGTTAIGVGLARAYLAEGASVALLTPDAEAGEAAIALLTLSGTGTGTGTGTDTGEAAIDLTGADADTGAGETALDPTAPDATLPKPDPDPGQPAPDPTAPDADARGAATGRGHRVMVVTGDASVRADVEGFIDATVERFGRIDILVNQAGDEAPPRSIVEISDEEWDLVLRRVLYSAFWATRRALKVMIPAGRGRIITISAGEGDKVPSPSPALQAGTEAVKGLTRSVAAAMAGSGITVNALCPGRVATDITGGPDGPVTAGAGRPNTVDEVAAIALLLASDAGVSINGAVVVVEGGTAHY